MGSRPMRCGLTLLLLSLAMALGGVSCAQRADLCGNGRLDIDEACDGVEFGGQTCLSLGYRSGQLACKPDCSLDSSACIPETFCEPACDPTLCERCVQGECLSGCETWETCQAGTCTAETTELRLFFTSDEHGWIRSGWSHDEQVFYGGAAELMTRLRERGYEPDDGGSLLLSDGDMWTGPAISTWYEGESVQQVMNGMGYSAAAVGNHEFDFGQDVLLARSQEADFPFLAANLLDAESGEPPAFAQPFTVLEVGGLQVGVIGLSLEPLSYVVCSDNLTGLLETGYEQALRDAAPLARAAGAQVLIVTAHVCPEDLMDLTWLARELGIVLMTAGHCHSTFINQDRGVMVVSPGASMTEFAQVDLELNAVTFELVEGRAEIVSNRYDATDPTIPAPDPSIQAIVDAWIDRQEEDLGDAIGYTANGIYGWALNNMAIDAFLMALPDADLAVMNTTGFRSSYPPGNITVADTVTVQPFENYLVVIELSGAQIVALFDSIYWPQCIAGARVNKSDGTTRVTVNGSPIDPTGSYQLVTTDYLLCQPDYFPYPVPPDKVTFTDVHWRQATEDWIRAQNSSAAEPLESVLDYSVRWID